MAFSFQIKHAVSHRTRIRIPAMKANAGLCHRMETRIRLFPGIAFVEVRPKSGSMILIHPEGPIPLDRVLFGVKEEVTAYLKTMKNKNKSASDPVSRKSKLRSAAPPAEKAGRNRYHVSGKTLILSGLTILYFMVRRIIFPIPPLTTWRERIVSIPFIAAFRLALPIQRQAVDNFKATGKVDMGMISTALVYLALFTGNIVSVLMVTWLFNFSGWMETRIKERTRQTVREMLTGQVTRAWKVVEGSEVEVALDDLLPGDLIALNPGDLIPVDGVVTKGHALIDESAMTGESLPLEKHSGGAVLAGTVIVEGGIHVRVDKTGEKTRLAAIIRFIESAETDRGELGRLSLAISQAMVPVSLCLAGVTFLVTGNYLQAMTVIMITCPCALRLSTSVAVSVAMGNAAAQGILIKGGSHVERAGRIDVLVVDKTGTLTRSKSTIAAITPVDKRYKEETILKLAASLLNTSRHPLGHAVVQAAHDYRIQLIPCEQRELIIGKGAKGSVGKQRILVGSRRLMEENGIVGVNKGHVKPADTTNHQTPGADRGENFYTKTGAQKVAPSHADACRDTSRIFVATDKRLIGWIEVGNKIREDTTLETMTRIRNAGVNYIIMLTGDTKSGSHDLKRQLGFDAVEWGVSPEGKADWIAKRRATHPGERIAVVGDGINDTPAFALSDLSFAVGEGGVDVTMEVADIVLQQGGIGQVATTLELGHETLKTIRQSYTIAIGFNAVTLFMMTLGIVSPIAGALLHNLTTVYAVANAAKSSKDAHRTIQTKKFAQVLKKEPI